MKLEISIIITDRGKQHGETSKVSNVDALDKNFPALVADLSKCAAEDIRLKLRHER